MLGPLQGAEIGFQILGNTVLIHIYINLFLHELPLSKTNINLAIHHSHNGLVTITKITIYLMLFFQGVVFDFIVSSLHTFSVVFEVKKRRNFPNAKGDFIPGFKS